MKNHSFSLVIPTLNEEKKLPLLLKTISLQTYNAFEVIIVDSLSTDKTKSIAHSFKKKLPSLKFIQGKFKNVSQARNYGASLSEGEFLVFFDADVKIESTFLEEINKKINQLNIEALTVWNRAEKGFKNKLIFFLLNLSMSLFQKIKPAANGACIIVKRSFFDKVQGFDEEIVFGEDFDLIQRLAKIKTRFAVFPRPILYASPRRFEKEGLVKSLFKSIKAIIYQLFFGPIKKPIFEYKMGGSYYEDKK